MKKVLSTILFVFCLAISAQDKYVEVGGSGTTCSIGSPCALTYAFSNAVAGETWHVKAGNYGNITSSQSNNGTSGSPIQFIGYKTTPGDISVANGSYGTFTYGNTVSATEMPYVIGTNQTSDNFLYINGDYVEIANFQAEAYNRMVHVNGDFNTVRNCIAIDFGDQSINTGSAFGKMFTFQGDNNFLTGCYAENAGAEFYLVTGNDNEMAWSEANNDNDINNTDYYVSVNSPLDVTHGNDNEMHHFKIYNRHNGSHNGHGYDVKGARNNHFHDNYSWRTYAAEVNFANSSGNTFEDHEADGDDDNQSGIWVFNGAHDNTFKNFKIRNTYVAITLRNYDDGAVSDPLIDEDYGGVDNTFINIAGSGLTKAMSFGESSAVVTVDGNDGNIIRNSTFDGGRIDIYNNTTANMIIENCSFSGAPQTAFIGSTALDPTDVIDYCNFFNNTYSTPSGSNYTNITAVDPVFTDVANDDLSLQATSNIKDSGKTISGITTDINGDAYLNSPPIGAYEYGGSPPSGIEGGGTVQSALMLIIN